MTRPQKTHSRRPEPKLVVPKFKVQVTYKPQDAMRIVSATLGDGNTLERIGKAVLAIGRFPTTQDTLVFGTANILKAIVDEQTPKKPDLRPICDAIELAANIYDVLS
jgi:hypothetical protein